MTLVSPAGQSRTATAQRAAANPIGPATVIALAAFGVAIVMVAEALFYQRLAEVFDDALLRVVVDAAVGGSYIVMGLVAWVRRPDSRIGPLLYLAGCVSFTGNFASVDVVGVHHLAIALEGVWLVLVGVAVLGYPSGRLVGAAPRVLAAVATVWVVGTGLLFVSQLDPARCEPTEGCPPNPIRLDLGPGFIDVLADVRLIFSPVIWIAFLALVVRRWWRATPAARHALRPLWVAGILLAISRMGELPVGALLGQAALDEYLTWVAIPATIGVPIALAYGLVRGRLDQAAVGDLVVHLRTTDPDRPLAMAIAEAIGDPGLTLAFPTPDGGLVDADGRPVAPPGADQRATLIEGPRGTTAVLIHDASLDANPGLIRSVAAATGLALENERLAAQVEAQLEEVRASRTRLAESAVAERARLERDLHDGAQQRLVALALRLRSIASGAPDGSTAIALDRAATELDEALAELRELARGIHPTAVVQGGLAVAVESLAERAALPVTTDVAEGRWPLPVEVAAWFVITEALTNATRHAAATRVTIRVATESDTLVVVVTDDGSGGADASGSGLTGLADRVAALDGTLGVSDGRDGDGGRGTTVRAVIPIVP